MSKLISTMTREDSGVTMIEYVLIAALIAIAAIVVIGAIGQNANQKFETINGALANATK